MTGPAENPSDRPTQLRELGEDAALQPQTEHRIRDDVPAPWYRNRLLLALWLLVVALLLTLVVYGIVELSRGGGGETSGPTGSTSSATTSSSAPSSTIATTAPSSTPETSAESPEQSPEDAPPPANGGPAPAEPPHHHHHPHIPSTITLPHTVITLPHGF